MRLLTAGPERLPCARKPPTGLGNVVRVRLKGVNTVRDYRKDGSFALYYYHRASGLRLTGVPGSPEFIESYAAAEKYLRARAKGTICDLIRRFEASPQFPKAESTRAEYRRKFKIIERQWGGAPISAFGEREFRIDALDWRDSIANRGALREADNLLSALSRLGSWALGRGELERNVLDKVERVYHSDRADKLWLPEHVAAFNSVASSELQTALLLAMHTGQRQGDLRRLPWSAYDGVRISLKQGKGGRLVSVRCTEALRAHLNGIERRGLLILLTGTGRTWSKRYFNQKWDEAYRASKIDAGLHFHDLRGTAVTMLAQAGCTVPEIAAITGHSLKNVTEILEVYLSRTRELADAAIVKLDAWAAKKPR
jgi:integrase